MFLCSFLGLALLLPATLADLVTWPECGHNDYDDGCRIPSTLDLEATKLSATSCDIKELHAHSFNSTPNLDEILLSFNELKEIDYEVFTSISNISLIYLNSNKLIDIPFGNSSFPRLINIDLSYNLITTINDTAFSCCEHLKYLDLHHNLIESIEDNAFNLPHLRTINLSNNRLTTISNILQIDTLKEVNLQANLIKYVSRRAFSRKLSWLFLQKNKLSSLPKHFVFSIPGLEWFSFYDNPWQCTCLLELLADVKEAGVKEWGSWYYMLDLPSCVAGMRSCQRQDSELE